MGGGEVERNSCSHSVHSIHPNTNKPNNTKVKKTNTKTHTNTVSTNQPTKPSHNPTTPNPRRDTPGEKEVGERGYGGRGKGNTTVKDTLNCALINARDLCNKKEEMVSYVYENTPDMVFVTESWANENTMAGMSLNFNMLSLSKKTSILCINGVRIGNYCSTSLNANACTLDTTTRTVTIVWAMYV